MRKVTLHGYVFVVADVRGSGASFGTRVDPTPPQAKPVKYFFCGGPSGSIKSANDGVFSPQMGTAGFDSYTVDYSTTSGSRSRWTGGPPAYPDMAANDRKALTYTAEPLTQAAEVVGHPVIHLWVQCPAPDIDVFAYLERSMSRGGRPTSRKAACVPHIEPLPRHHTCLWTCPIAATRSGK